MMLNGGFRVYRFGGFRCGVFSDLRVILMGAMSGGLAR